ncbi:hypothetical protein HYR99_18710 [Candidatus Poribacteria bacterium]|nr:hypothetical protein [Candidatus Poribacteria bacterium]
MNTQKIEDLLPEVYRNFFPVSFKFTIPKETAATCENCAMCQKPGQDLPSGHYFLPDTKCCTYHPVLRNYLVGALLNNTQPAFEEGRRRIREKINNRIGVTPHGVRPPAKYSLLYEKSRSLTFGKSQSLLCPYYEKEGGTCTVWPFREATCMTYYCKSVAGKEGHLFWATLKKYLSTVETTLGEYALYKMGWDAEKIITSISSEPSLTVEDLEDQPPSDKNYRDLWGDWVGREEDFYQETHRLVTALTPEDFERIVGISATIILEEFKKKRQEMVATTLPKTLKRNPFLQVHKCSDGTYALVSYSNTNPLQVGSLVYSILDLFDGQRSNEEVCQLSYELIEEELKEDLLTQLYQFRVLVAADE